MRGLLNSIYIDSNSLLMTLAMSFCLMNEVIGINGASIINLSVIVVFFVLGIMHGTLRIYPSAILVVAVFLFGFILSFLRLGFLSSTFSYFAFFCAFGILFFIISTQEISISAVLRNNVIIGAVCVIILQLRGFDYLDSGAVMGISYGMLPLFLSAISGSICHKQYRTLHLLGLCILGFTVIQIAPRGIWVSVLAFFAVLCFHYLCRKGDSRKRLMKIVAIIGLAMVVAVILILNFEKIITDIHYFFLYNFGIRIKALQKFVSYFKQGDVLNGRTVLWDIAKACIEGNLIFGRGIGYYETLAEGSHSHNFLLQSLCEGGLLFFIPVCVMVLRSVRHLVFAGNEVKQEDYVFFALLFTCGVVPMIFSSTYWIYVIFWLFLGRYFKIGFRHQFVTENGRC